MGFSVYLPTIPPPPRADLKPLPNTIPLTPQAAILPPLLYYLALLLLPPVSPSPKPTLLNNLCPLTPLIRNALALLSALLFFRLPLTYHVPFSIGLTYQLSLVGLYGGCRVIDTFFISPYLFNHIPRRVKYHHAPRHDITPSPTPKSTTINNNSSNNAPTSPLTKKRSNSDSTSPTQSYFTLHFLRTAGQGLPVTETATTDSGYPDSFTDRLSWALELELSMRGAGFTWTSADVRHTRRTWRPTPRDRLHSILLHVLPPLILSWAVTYDICTHYISHGIPFDVLPLGLQLALTAALGAYLMCIFSLGHSLSAILTHPLEPHPLAYFPPLYTARAWSITSVRGFWSFGWHRLFSRLFLVYGVWPGQWVERTLLRKAPNEPADVGKVLGGFLCSGLVHAFAGHAVLGGWGHGAGGELVFFAENGVAVVVEEGVKGWTRRWRKGIDGTGREERWYDGVVGRVWWVSVLLFTGRNFARGWTRAGLVSEMAGA